MFILSFIILYTSSRPFLVVEENLTKSLSSIFKVSLINLSCFTRAEAPILSYFVAIIVIGILYYNILENYTSLYHLLLVYDDNLQA